MRVVVTGAGGAVGRHVADRLAHNDAIAELVGVDLQPGYGIIPLDLRTDDLGTVLHKDDVVVHLAASPLDFAGDVDAGTNDLDILDRLLAAAEVAEVGHLVLASSSMVYGAWPENPVPLAETEPVRPNPEFRFAVARAEMEAKSQEWANRTGKDLTILRSATTLARGRENGLAKLLRHSAAIRVADGEAPAQFLHAEDFATAVEVVAVGHHGGIYNVAPDGWLRPAELAALRGTPDTQLRMPGFAVSAVSAARRQFGAQTHPGLTAYLQYPWAVANDSLRSLGWEPEFSNEEAYVAGHQPSRFDGVTAKRRQELALGAAGAAIAGGSLGLLALLRWLWGRR